MITHKCYQIVSYIGHFYHNNGYCNSIYKHNNKPNIYKHIVCRNIEGNDCNPGMFGL